jgi:transglutaminase-like putative cysteine protease
LARTALSVGVVALLVTVAWGSLERTSLPAGKVAAMILFALLPVLAASRGLGRLRVMAIGLVGSVLAASVAFDIPLADARPRDGEYDFVGPVLDAFRGGILDFYDTPIPFARGSAPLMHGVILLAIFGAVAAAGSLIAFRRPIGAAVVVLVAIGVPATLAPGDSPLQTGALVLAGLLLTLFLLRDTLRPARALGHGAIAGLVLVIAATAASSSNAVAKGAFVAWQSWDPYDAPSEPVGVRYVWNSHYLGISFPEEPTTVFKVRVPGSRRNLYWRATTLDTYDGRGWRETVEFGEEAEDDEIVRGEQLLPPAARDPDNWIRQEFTIEALRDRHLIASNQPMRWSTPNDVTTQTGAGGDVVVLPDGLSRDQRYTVWSYVAQPKPARLAESGTEYPKAIAPYLEAFNTVPVPKFGVPSRDALMDVIFDGYQDDVIVGSHRGLYETAREVVGEAASPYAAALTLEAWFRTSGGFRYDEQPPLPGTLPALVSFVLDHKRGYCQYYAGAMATMLRLLGVPARVAAGFTSGSFDATSGEWTVTDHNAHTWVEVFFPGFGWIPFDPTPGRGLLNARYSAVTPTFAPDARDAALLFGNPVLDGIRSQQGRPGLEGATRQPDPGSGAGGVVRENAPSILTLIALLLAGGIILVTLAKAIRRALRFAGSDVRGQATACRRDLAGFLADQGVELPTSATLADIGEAVDRDFGVDLRPFVDAATAARFAPPKAADPAVRRARWELRRSRRQLRRQLSLASRARGAVSLRSLGL